jgi:hypothetical protein
LGALLREDLGERERLHGVCELGLVKVTDRAQNGLGHLLAITDIVCTSAFSRRGRRSIRVLSTACTVGGTTRSSRVPVRR